MEEATLKPGNDEKTNSIIIEEIDPEEINRLWDSFPEIKSAF
jgi:hypothetical protein